MSAAGRIPALWRRTVLVAALITLATPVAGCTTRGTESGNLLIAMPADPSCLDPQQTGQLTAQDIARSVVDTLTDQDPRTGASTPWLAESFGVREGARAFDFVLRPGITFSDGTPVDARAVEATFDSLSRFPATGPAAYLSGYAGTTVHDARSLTVRFSAPNAQFLQATSQPGLGIMSIGTARTAPEQRCRGEFTGSGPFTIDHYTANQEVVLARRADYRWPSPAATNKGAAHLAEIQFLFVPEAGTRTGVLSSGQVHVAQNIQPIDQKLFDGNGFRLLTALAPGVVPPLSPNHAGILSDPRVRHALLLGIDRRQLVSTALSPWYEPATSVLSSATPLFTPTGELRFDPQRARRLLDEAGWAPGPGGIRVRDGQPLTLRWLVPAPMPPENEFVQQQLRKIGVGIRFDVVPAAQYGDRQRAGNFDLTAVAVTRADPDVLRTLFHTEGANLWHLPPSELDTYLEQQAAATSDETRQRAVTAAVDWLLEHADTVPLYEKALVHGVSSQVRNLEMDASTRLDLHDAYLG